MKIADLADIIQDNEQAITNIVYSNGKLATECFDTFFANNKKKGLTFDFDKSESSGIITESIKIAQYSYKTEKIVVKKVFLNESGVLTIKGTILESDKEIELPFNKLKDHNKVQVFKMFYGYLVA